MVSLYLLCFAAGCWQVSLLAIKASPVRLVQSGRRETSVFPLVPPVKPAGTAGTGRWWCWRWVGVVAAAAAATVGMALLLLLLLLVTAVLTVAVIVVA